jgi:hypothetical protein
MDELRELLKRLLSWKLGSLSLEFERGLRRPNPLITRES